MCFLLVRESRLSNVLRLIQLGPVAHHAGRATSERSMSVRLMRFGRRGAERPAALGRDGILMDLSAAIGGDFTAGFWRDGGLDRVRHLVESDRLPILGRLTAAGLDGGLVGARIGPPVAVPRQIVRVGGMWRPATSRANPPGPTSSVVVDAASSDVAGPCDPIAIAEPPIAATWGGEIAIVIGRRLDHVVSPDDAAATILGYTLSHRHASTRSLGPWLATPDEIAGVDDLAVRLWVNDVLQQNMTTQNSILGVPSLLWWLSQLVVLEPGDIVDAGPSTCWAAGRGRDVRVGDVVELEAAGLGVHTHVVVRGGPTRP